MTKRSRRHKDQNPVLADSSSPPANESDKKVEEAVKHTTCNCSVMVDREAEQRLRAALEEELTCVVCQSMFIEPRVVGCGHVFCKTCLDKWTYLHKTCPLCCSALKSVNFRKSSLKVYAVSSLVEKVADAMLPQEREKRKRSLEERQLEKGAKKRRGRDTC